VEDLRISLAEIDFRALFEANLHPIVERIGIEKNLIAVHHFAIENFAGERILNEPLNGAPRSLSRAQILFISEVV
jgi:hypothetical protein